MLIIRAPSYSLAQAAWIPRLTIWRDHDTTERLEGEPCESWAAAMAASWRLTSRTGPRSQERVIETVEPHWTHSQNGSSDTSIARYGSNYY